MKPLLPAFLFAWLPMALAQARALPPQEPADLIKLISPSGAAYPVGEITDPAPIARITAFINALPTKWDVPWYGPPVGRIYLTFRRDGKFAGNFYVGPDFFGRDRGGFWSQHARRKQLMQLGELPGFDLIPLLTRAAPPKTQPSNTVRQKI